MGDGFLGECRGLTSVTLPEGLTSVGSDFLAYCTGLTSLTLPGGLTGVGDYFLYECTGLTSLTLPGGLESVGHAFLIGCRGLTSLTLPEGLESAGDYFLSLCTGLKELTVLAATPPAVGSNGAFEGVDNAIPVYVPAGSIPAYAGAAVWDYFDTYLPIGTVAHGTCGAEGDGSNIIWYLTADGTLTLSGTGEVADFKLGAQPWQAHRASIRTAVVGEGVTGIGNNFLYGCPSLDSITLPETLESVGGRVPRLLHLPLLPHPARGADGHRRRVPQRLRKPRLRHPARGRDERGTRVPLRLHRPRLRHPCPRGWRVQGTRSSAGAPPSPPSPCPRGWRAWAAASSSVAGASPPSPCPPG